MSSHTEAEDACHQQVKRRGSSNGRPGSGIGRSRPRASLACMNCRQRKIKCSMDSSRSSCSSCRTLQVTCVISRDGDRRKAGSREQVSILQDRLQQLESIVAQQSGPPHRQDANYGLLDEEATDNTSQQRRATEPSLSAFGMYNRAPDYEYSRTPWRGKVSDGFERRPGSNDGSQALSTAPSETRQEVPGGSQSLDPSLKRNALPGGSGFEAAITPVITPSSAGQLYASNHIGPGTEAGRLTPPSEKDSARLDIDGTGNQPRFYGPTSQQYIHSRTIPDDDDSSNIPSNPVAAVNLDSAPVRAVLLNKFWKAQPLSQALVDQSFFEAGRKAGARSQHYSQFLENGILAVATRFSTSPDIRSLAPKYAERATAHVTQELANPTIATLQGFLILSDLEATRGRDRLGYMYCGIGCRMVFDLGLQASCSDLIARGKLSRAEALLRHTLFLGAYIYDKTWSLYLGRPSVIPNSMMLAAQQRVAEQGWTVPATLDGWVGLCTDISEVTEILNSDAPLDWDSMGRLTNLDAKIKRRCEALPHPLALDEHQISDLPANAYGLHIQFRGIRVVLHRLLSRALAHNAPHDRSPHDDSIEHSRALMYENAISIARLTSVYQQIYGIENFITIMLDNMFVAAAILVSHVLRQEDPSISTDQEIYWLRCLADMLAAAQKHYPVVARIRSTLASLVEKTFLIGIFGTFEQPEPENAVEGDLKSHRKDGFVDHGALVQSGALVPDQDQSYMQAPFAEGLGYVSQDMDMTNMMSWILSPMD